MCKYWQELKSWIIKAQKSNGGKQVLLLISMMLYALIVRILVVIFITEIDAGRELSTFLAIVHVFLFLLICKICFGRWWNVEDKEK